MEATLSCYSNISWMKDCPSAFDSGAARREPPCVIYHWIATGQLGRDLTRVARRARASRRTKLDRYTPIITERPRRVPGALAVRLMEEIRAAGYTGGYTQLRSTSAQVRPRRGGAGRAVRDKPGHQAQVDFAEFQFPWGKRYALVVVLGYSRLLWLRFYERQDMAHAFRPGWRRRSPSSAACRGDPVRSDGGVITKDLRPGGQLVENEEFLRFAAHWGFRPAPAALPGEDQGQGGAADPLRARELRLRAGLHG